MNKLLISLLACTMTAAVSATNTIEVNLGENLTLSGQTVSDNIVVNGGSLDLNNTTVSGNVRINENGSLSMSNGSTIKGTLKGDSYSQIDIDDSAVEGLTQLTNGGATETTIDNSQFYGFFDISSSALRASHNVFHKAVSISDKKTHYYSIRYSTLLGDLKATGAENVYIGQNGQLGNVNMNGNNDVRLEQNTNIQGNVKLTSNRAAQLVTSDIWSSDAKLMDNQRTDVQFVNVDGTLTIYPAEGGTCSDLDNTYSRLKGGCDN